MPMFSTFKLVKGSAIVAGLLLFGTTAMAQDDITWRKAAWTTVPSSAAEAAPARMAEEKDLVFSQAVTITDVVEIEGMHTVEMAKMPLAKDELRALSFAEGDRYYRMTTPDADMAVYCAGDVGYTAKSAMIKLSSRFCLGDRDDDGTFDQMMLAGVSAAAPDAGLLISLLGLDDSSFQPLLMGVDPSQTLSIPYRKAEPTSTVFHVGPVFMVKGKKLAIALGIGSPGQANGAPTAPYDPAVETVTDKWPKILSGRPGFKHITPVDTSSLPTDIEFHGAKMRVHSFGSKGVEVEVLEGFPVGETLPVGFSGALREGS